MVLVHPHLTDVEFSIPAPPSTSTKSMFSGGPALFASLTMLTSLTIRECEYLDDSQVLPIAQHCTALQSLTLLNASGITEASFVPLSRSTSEPRSAPARCLGLHAHQRPGTPIFFAKYSGNYQLFRVGKHCAAIAAARRGGPWRRKCRAPGSPIARTPTPTIARATSPTSPTVSTAVVAPRTDGRVGGNLTTLCIPGIRRQSRGGLVAFLQEMVLVHPHLTDVEFSIPAPPSTSTKSMFSGGPALFASLTMLTSLTIRECEYLDDSQVLPIAQHCTALQSLTLLNASGITEASFVPLVMDLRHLRGVTQKATVIYRERANAESAHRDIHLVTHAARGLVRDEYDVGAVGSGGAPMLWTIFPAQQQGGQPQRPPLAWFCRFARSALRRLLDEYVWIPVPVRVHAVVPAAGVAGVAGVGAGVAE
ncbi:hypothetical protein AMAG_17926 [Allomyces macrogynus ATCC 38327]|uniref:F-box domain-containing protein n=1 Tax=Allomyces macrogynus (strain ATCC 38327) TaxID=578462 RepID=A0A0L0S279_ALLM3|nr:hypothetical protein AMAG_17926 [Allomyces macrogynus ATCC 38327]|eukprot:KNE56496.1 hypothetical protein AMAG_17926 [Allomyces macrogynus ATCC 38327]